MRTLPRLALLVPALWVAGCGAREGDGAAPDASADRSTDAAPGDPPADAASDRDAGESLGAWTAGPAMPRPLQELGAAVVGDRVVLVGGFEGEDFRGAVGTVWWFAPGDRVWTEGPPLPVPRHHVTVAVLGGDVYGIGGMTTSWQPVADVRVLREGATEWDDLDPLPEPRAAAAAAVVGDEIVVVGGQTRGGALAADVLVFSRERGWRRGAPIPTRREHLAAVAHAGEVWALAGRALTIGSAGTVVEIYDVAEDGWRSGPSLAVPHGGFGAAVLDGVIYAVGGEIDRRDALDDVERLALPDGDWTPAPPVPTPRHGQGVVSLDGRLWVLGGGDRRGLAPVAAAEAFTP